jgi:hypothetical protein
MAVGISASGAILSQEGDAAATRGAMPTAALAEAACEQMRSRDRDFWRWLGGGLKVGTPGTPMLRLVRLVMGSADPPFAPDDGWLSNAPLMEWFGGLANVALKLLAADVDND